MIRPVRERPRRGAGLLEVIIAVILFGVIATVNLSVLTQLSRRLSVVAAGAARYGTESEVSNRMASLPYDSVSAHAGCRTLTTETTPSRVCVSVSSQSTTRTVTVVWTPTDAAIRPDSVILTRSTAPTGALRPYPTTWSNNSKGY
jgi:type II secretory pathway component PulJ